MFQKEVIVDCRGHLYGRLASIVAKELLSGQKIVRVLVASLSFVVLAHLGLAQTLVRTEEIVRSGSCTCQQRTGGREERERRERKKDDDEKEKKKLFFPFAFNVRCRLALTIFFLLLGSFAGSRSLATVYRNKRKCKPTHTREKKKKKKAKNFCDKKIIFFSLSRLFSLPSLSPALWALPPNSNCDTKKMQFKNAVTL
jgi:hypothetical protein